MRTRWIAVGIAVLFCLPGAAAAEDRPYLATVERFFQTVDEGTGVEGLTALYATNPWMARSKDAVENVKTQFAGLGELVGSYQDHALLVEKRIADRLVYLSYFVAYERQPVRFEFEFYRPKDAWMLYSFSLDDSIDDELEERGRAEAMLAAD